MSMKRVVLSGASNLLFIAWQQDKNGSFIWFKWEFVLNYDIFSMAAGGAW